MEIPQTINTSQAKGESDPAEIVKKMELQLAALRPSQRAGGNRMASRMSGLIVIGLMVIVILWAMEWAASQMKAEGNRADTAMRVEK